MNNSLCVKQFLIANIEEAYRLSTYDRPFHDPEQRDRLLAYRESEEKLMEAASILLQNGASFS